MKRQKDLVLCVKNAGYSSIIQVGKVYEVARVNKDTISIIVNEKKFVAPKSYFEAHDE